MWKELLRQLTLSMAAMDPVAWSYYVSSLRESGEYREEQRPPQARAITVVQNGDSSLVAERQTAA
jgi:hypothetical protein